MLQIYKASAGSGKTYTLAREYIKALVGIKDDKTGAYALNLPKYVAPSADTANRHRFILAITFTNKATEEMKRRIVDELDDLSKMPYRNEEGDLIDANYANLTEDLHCSRAELAEASALALRHLLHDYHNFNVSTIDSFFQRVLRTFARELDHQGDYAIEIESGVAVRKSIDNMVDDFNLGTIEDKEASTALEQWIIGYLLKRNDQGQKTNFFNRSAKLYSMLVDMVSKITDEDFKEHYDRMREYLADRSRLEKFEKAIDKRIEELLAKLREDVMPIIEGMESEGFSLEMLNKSVVRRFINDNVNHCTLPKNSDIASDTLLNVAAGEKNPLSAKKYNAYPQWRTALQDICILIVKAWYEAANLADVRESLPQLGLLSFVWDYIDRFVIENNTVLLSDTNHLLSRIINGSDTPFVYERMGVTLRHFLIDEFQDTSRMQWTNLRPLVSDAVGQGGDNLIIGDEKQSIYRFRNSDSQLLHHVVETRDFPRESFDTVVRGNLPEENTNYRSAADIVEFNNTLFSVLAAMTGVDCYGNVVQQVCGDNLDYRGYVHFIPTEKNDDEEILRDMVSQMHRQHDEGGYDWGDIVVLAVSNKECEKVVDYIMTHYPEIPLMSEESLYLMKSPAIQRIVGTLKVLEQAGAGIAHGTESHYIKISPAEVSVISGRYEFFRGEGECCSAAIDEAADIFSPDNHTIERSIAAIRQHRPASLVALVETIAREELGSASADQVAFIAAFQDYVLDYCSRFSPTLTAFLGHWETVKNSVAIPAAVEVKSVRVMTVHKSKGLEFKCVHIPFCSWGFPGEARKKWLAPGPMEGIDPDLCPPALYIQPSKTNILQGTLFHKDYLREKADLNSDALNLTYVAFTRAEAELIVYYTPKKDVGKALAQAFDDAVFAPCRTGEPGEIVAGEPTRRRIKKKKVKETNIIQSAKTLDAYNVAYNDNVLTRVTDVLELDSDVDDNDCPPEAVQISSPRTSVEEDEYADDSSRFHGVVMHDALSRIATESDVERAVESAARTFSLDTVQTERLAADLHSMLGCGVPEVARWFARGADAVCEQAVYDPGSGEIRRPDRVVFLPDGTVEVIDYKFTSGKAHGHSRQVCEYMDLLVRMGHGKVKGYLWYPFLDPPEICPVSR